MPKNAVFICEKCNFKCSKKSNYSIHILTRKHTNAAANEGPGNKMETLETLETPGKCQPNNAANYKHNCIDCGKMYKTRGGLWKHIQNCKKPDAVINAVEIKQIEPIPQITTEFALNVLKQSDEFKNMIMEQNKIILQQNDKFAKHSDALLKSNEAMIEMSKKLSVGTTNSNNRITNNITNHFNLNLFLNDTCKDAINISDFIENVQIQMKELENVGTNGYVNGITDIILSRLKELDVSKRPVHCTDLKREILYVRDENEWNKDSEEKSKIKNMITKIADKNYRKIPEWRRENPDCREPENQQYDFCINLMRNSLGDLGDEQIKLDNKIIKNIAKQVLVDKTVT